MTVPPVNSMEKCRPRVTRKNTAAAKVMKEMALKINACFISGRSRLMRKSSMFFSSGLGSHVGRLGVRLPDLADGHALELLLAAVPEVHEAAREHDGREHRGQDAQAVHDGK